MFSNRQFIVLQGEICVKNNGIVLTLFITNTGYIIRVILFNIY